ncbi:hypothetical protein IW150_003513 [Coemansia sp. RSA 2607]|nr:hypothetical protein IW150_003513 [Coemansia sp. RSA 2607]
MSGSKKDSGETPSGVSHPYSDKPAIAAAVAKAHEKRAAAETASLSGAAVSAAAEPREDEKPVTQEEMRGYMRSVEELRAMIERLVIASPGLGAAAQAAETPSPDGLGSHFGYDNAQMFRTPATMVPEPASSADVRGGRPKASVGRYKSAVLIVNGKQTSCEAALVDSSAAIVAASCLQYKGNTVDSNQSYELVIKLGSGDSNSQKVSISTITVHPEYDASSYINNLAVVQFNTGAPVSWQNYLAVNPDEWDNEYFARHSLTNSYSLTWNNIVAFSTMSTPSDCAKASKVYSENSGDFLCNYAASLSIYNRDCKVPYGTVYAVVQPDDFGVAAIHSHSAIYGDSLCSSDKKLHYYTLLRNYIPWAARVIGRSIGGFSKDTSFHLSINYDYSMKTVSSTTVSGVKVFAGDRYSQDPVNPALADPAPPASSNTAAGQSTQVATSTKAPVITNVPATNAPATNAPATNAPATNAPVTSAPANQATGSSAAGTTAGLIDNSAAATASSNASLGNSANAAQTSGNSAAQTSVSSGGVSGESTDSVTMSSSTQESSASSASMSNSSNAESLDKTNENDGDGQAVVLTDVSGSQSASSPTASDGSSSSPTSNSADINIGPSETENLGSKETTDASNSSSANNAGKNNNSSGSKRTAIIVIVIIVLLGLIGGGAWWFIRRRRKVRQSAAEKNGWNSPRGSVRSSLSPAYLPRGEEENRDSGFSGVTRGYYGDKQYDGNRVLDYNDAFIEGTQSGGQSARDNRTSYYNYQQNDVNNQRYTDRYSNYRGNNYRDTFQQTPGRQSAYLHQPIQQQMPMPTNNRGNYEGNF